MWFFGCVNCEQIENGEFPAIPNTSAKHVAMTLCCLREFVLRLGLNVFRWKMPHSARKSTFGTKFFFNWSECRKVISVPIVVRCVQIFTCSDDRFHVLRKSHGKSDGSTVIACTPRNSVFV